MANTMNVNVNTMNVNVNIPLFVLDWLEDLAYNLQMPELLSICFVVNAFLKGPFLVLQTGQHGWDVLS